MAVLTLEPSAQPADCSQKPVDREVPTAFCIMAPDSQGLTALALRTASIAWAHRSLEEGAPERLSAQPPPEGRIIATPEVGGLHHRYERRVV